MEEFYTPAENPAENTVTPVEVSFFDKIKDAFSSTLALVTAIFLTLAFAVPFILGIANNHFSLPLFELLLMIAGWIVYAGAKSGKLNVNGYKIFSGVVKAKVILMWIAFALAIIVAIFCFLAPGIIKNAVGEIPFDDFLNDPAVFEEIAGENVKIDLSALNEALQSEEFTTALEWLSENGLAFIFTVAGIVCLFAAVVVMVFAILYGQVHKFTKSLCVSLDADENKLVKVGFTRGFMMFLGICTAIGVLFSFGTLSSLITTAVSAVLYFLYYTLLKKDLAA